MLMCHYCEKDGAEHYCPNCGEPTCEDCFDPMTQFNAGRELPCLAYANAAETQQRAENARERAREEAARKKREQRAAEARVRYNSPEAAAKRAQEREARRLADAERERETAERLARVMKDFARFF